MSENSSLISIQVGVPFEPPLLGGVYQIGKYEVVLSHPQEIDFFLNKSLPMPNGASSLFEFRWSGDVASERKLKSSLHEKWDPVHEVLATISEMMLCIKMMMPGHIASTHIRSMGTSDFLFVIARVGGVEVLNNLRMPMRFFDDPRSTPTRENTDAFGTTELVKQHFGADTFPVSRRLTRCIELLEHGYYGESIIVSHSLMDDVVQEVLRALIKSKGVDADPNRLLRAVKEDRLATFLGPMLKIVAGVTMDEIWPASSHGVTWINSLRNKIAHNGAVGNRDQACVAVYVTTMIIGGLHSRSLCVAEFPDGLFRHVRILAAWTINPPAWVIQGSEVERDPYASAFAKATDVESLSDKSDP